MEPELAAARGHAGDDRGVTGNGMDRAAPLLLLLLLLASAGCAPGPVPEAFPQDVADGWIERYTAHDAAGVAALYTEDAQLLPPDAEIVSGRAAIQEFIERTNPPGSAALEIATVETLVFGDYAYRQGSFRLNGGANAQVSGNGQVSGKFIELWKKTDGKWLIHRDIWSANAPLPAPTATADAPS